MRKYGLWLVICLGTSSLTLLAQEKPEKCKFKAAVINGEVNGLKPTSTMEEIQKKLPCFTSTTPEDAGNPCGGGVFYQDNNIFFYTGLDFIEIREGYIGELDARLFMYPIDQVDDYFTRPAKTEVRGDGTYYYYKQKYGCLVVRTGGNGLVDLLQVWSHPWEEVKLCD